MARTPLETKALTPTAHKADLPGEIDDVDTGDVEVVNDGLVEVTLAHYYGTHRPGDTARVSPDLAASLYDAGYTVRH